MAFSASPYVAQASMPKPLWPHATSRACTSTSSPMMLSRPTFRKHFRMGGKLTEGCEATDDFLGFGDGDFQEENLLG